MGKKHDSQYANFGWLHNPLFPMRNIMLSAYLEGIFILTCTPCEFKTRTGVFSPAFK